MRVPPGSNWSPAAILPNLAALKAVEGDVIALARHDDPRVLAFCAAHPKFKVLLSRFTNAFQVHLDPVVLIVRDDLLPKLARVEPLASFRDLVAACVIPYCRSLATVYSNPHRISYSNSFSFYPWMLGRDNEHLVASTPAMKALQVVDDFRGQSSPDLPEMQLSEIDEPLYDSLLGRWTRYYLGSKQRWQDRALFRSLNMATQAAQLPSGIDTTLYDLGRVTALWVSAFEILAHPRTARSGLDSVYPLLEHVSYHDQRVGRRRYAAYTKGKARQRRSLPCWLYGKLYQARNAFLHGNPVRISLLSPNNSEAGLFWLAPSLYRLALTGFLGMSFKKRAPTGNNARILGRYIADKTAFEDYQKVTERALLMARRR